MLPALVIKPVIRLVSALLTPILALIIIGGIAVVVGDAVGIDVIGMAVTSIENAIGDIVKDQLNPLS